MSDELKKLSPDELLSLQIDVRRQRADALAKLDEAIADALRAGGKSISPHSATITAAKITLTDDELRRLPLGEAAFQYLATCKKPQSSRQIWAALEKTGRKLESETPVKAVKWALRKLVPSKNDLVHIGWDRWHVRSQYKTKAALEKLLIRRAGRGGKTKKEHAKATRTGMKNAQAKGKRLGRPPAVKPEVIERAKDLIRGGASLVEVCATLGMSKQSLHYYGIRVRQLKREGSKPAKLNLGEPQEADNVVRFSKS